MTRVVGWRGRARRAAARRLRAAAGAARCAPPPGRSTRSSCWAEEGAPIARAITSAADVPDDRARRRRRARWTVRARAGDDAAAPDAISAPSRVEAVGVSGAHLREGDSAGRRARRRSPGARCRLPKANAASGSSCSATPAAGSSRSGNVVPGLQRSRGSGRSLPSPTRRPPTRARSRDPRRRLSLSRERVSRRQRRVRGQPVGLRLGRVGGRLLRAGGEAPRGGALDRRARQPRVLQSRGAGLVALPRSAAARRRDRTATTAADDAIGDYSEPYAVPLGTARRRHAVHRVRFVAASASRRCAPDNAMYVTYRAQFERAFALARAPAEHVLHESSSGARVRAESGEARDAVSRQRRAAVGAADARSRPCCSRRTSRRCSPVTCTCSRS